MKTTQQTLPDNSGPNTFICTWHLAMVFLCFATCLTGDMAGDYKKLKHTGFLIHGHLGMVLCIAIFIYIAYGLIGPCSSRFSKWFPFKGEQLRQTRNDLGTLLRFKLPTHKRHQGLAGLVQFLGILLFCWLATTGSLLYFFIDPGNKARGILHVVKEAHEIGVILIPLYLGVHIGAVVTHSFTGNQAWKDIFFLGNRSATRRRKVDDESSCC